MKRQGQTLAEYTIVATIIAIVLASMGTGVRRSIQVVIKDVADVVGWQADAEQAATPQEGYLVCATTNVQSTSGTDRTQEEDLYSVTETGTTIINSAGFTNTGFTNELE